MCRERRTRHGGVLGHDLQRPLAAGGCVHGIDRRTKPLIGQGEERANTTSARLREVQPQCFHEDRGRQLLSDDRIFGLRINQFLSLVLDAPRNVARFGSSRT